MKKGDTVIWKKSNQKGMVASTQDYEGLGRVHVHFINDPIITNDKGKEVDVNFGFKTKWIKPEELELIK